MSTRPHQRHFDALVRALRENGRLLAALAGRCEAVGLGPPTDGATFRRPGDIAAYLAPEMAHLAQEQLRVVLLDRRNRFIDAPLVYQGGQTETAVRLADCFREAVRRGAAALILVHCHPSGDPGPSVDDVQLTREAGHAGELLGIQVLDHIVIAREGFVSLRQAGLYVTPPPAAARVRVDSLPDGSATPARLERSWGDGVLRWGYDCGQCGARVRNLESSRISCQGCLACVTCWMIDVTGESHEPESVQPAAA